MVSRKPKVRRHMKMSNGFSRNVMEMLVGEIKTKNMK